MDQLRKALAWLKKYHFWVLSVLVAVIALACWKMAAAKLKQRACREQIHHQGGVQQPEKFRGKPFHPNDDDQ